jgi:hypothetical protein
VVDQAGSEKGAKVSSLLLACFCWEEKGGCAMMENPFPVPSLEEQLVSIQEDGRETLYVCLDSWALRHRFVARGTGEVIRARCDRWQCLHCGPRKVDLWRQLIRAAGPALLVTLTKVGWTVEEAARVRTTVIQRLRRGFRRADASRKGYREAYPIEYLAVLERHQNFEENGFHCHLLINGVDYIPKQVVSEALSSATRGRSYIVDVQRIRNERAIGYVTKYLTKHITDAEQGMRSKEQEIAGIEEDDEGKPHLKRKRIQVQVKSRARRICYSRHFFPDSVAALRKRLLDGWTEEEENEGNNTGDTAGWVLLEVEQPARDRETYHERKERALREVVEARRARGARLSRRVLSIWNYQQAIREEEWRRREEGLRGGGESI